MIRFLVNDRAVSTELPPGSPVVDFLRGPERMHGVRVGCREGDCGACAVLVGDLSDGHVRYRILASCILPLGNARGKHIVNVEGLNLDELTPVQQAFVDMRAIQCGFCTPGYVVSMTAFLIGAPEYTREAAIDALAGNICRCTGYKAVERAADVILEQLADAPAPGPERIPWLVRNRFVPAYFEGISERLAALESDPVDDAEGLVLSGGSDLLVQRPEAVIGKPVRMVHDIPRLKTIRVEDGRCHVGSAVTFNELRDSEVLAELYPQLATYVGFSGSDLVRNMATVGGNIVNGSPIGDVSVFFTAQSSTLVFSRDGQRREVPIREFFVGYKTTAIEPGELLEEVVFDVPDANTHYSFEKTSKRQHLDMAVVNSGLRVTLDGGIVTRASYAVGGLGSTIRILSGTEDYLVGKPIDAATFRGANEVAQGEITPRSRPEYKRLLVRQQLFLHLRRFAPDALGLEVLR
jgi:xanthine dehydrogenase small subunit